MPANRIWLVSYVEALSRAKTFFWYKNRHRQPSTSSSSSSNTTTFHHSASSSTSFADIQIILHCTTVHLQSVRGLFILLHIATSSTVIEHFALCVHLWARDQKLVCFGDRYQRANIHRRTPVSALVGTHSLDATSGLKARNSFEGFANLTFSSETLTEGIKKTSRSARSSRGLF